MAGLLSLAAAIAACTNSEPGIDGADGSSRAANEAAASSRDLAAGRRGVDIQHVFVIAMENHDKDQIVGNTDDAPYLNDTLIAKYASASSFIDQLPLVTPSEPHYVWMEAGTNEFDDHVFDSDAPPSASNSTASREHLVTQIRDAEHDLSWLSYQEGLSEETGACPIEASDHYAPKHDPFVFFQDVAGSLPSKTNEYCAAHHRPLEALAHDIETGDVASYNFIVPDQCHDMHGQWGCFAPNELRAGDAWLEDHLPALIRFVMDNSGVIFIVWDEGDQTATMPFVAVGPGVKPGYVSPVEFTHSSLLKSVELILGLQVLDSVAEANDFADLFEPGSFP
jgi:hypothetical protein